METLKKVLIGLIIITTILIIVLTILIYVKWKEKVETEETNKYIVTLNKEIVKVKDANMFFTVTNCVQKYIDYISKNDKLALLYLLDEEYVSINVIAENNIGDYINFFDKQQIFSAKKMYLEDIAVDKQRFFVYGTIRENSMTERFEEQEFYAIITLNMTDWTFSVTPYDGAIFALKGGENE